MPLRHQGWYDQNGAISYPIADNATCLADDGVRLQPNIIVDLNIRWPGTLGDYAFVSGVSVTENAVTVVLQAADSPNSSALFTPLAVITVPRPVTENRVYPLVGQLPGVGGWIVFGEGIREFPYNGRFSSPAQTVITPRAGRSYRSWPVEGAQVLSMASVLNGVVGLKAQSPLEIAMEERDIAGVVRDVIVCRLIDPDRAQGVTAVASTLPVDNIFKQYAGPCAGRPESNTCGDPAPIEFINSVGPDCDGVLTLDFTGCAIVGQIVDYCGVTLECNFELTDACLPRRLPDSTGTLPSEYTAAIIPIPDPPPPVEPPTPESESLIEVGELPYTDCFSDLEATDFTVESGLWTFVGDNSPDQMCEEEVTHYSISTSIDAETTSVSSLSSSMVLASYATATAGARNISLWEGSDDSSTYRRVQTDLKLVAGPAQAKHNGGFILNYRPHQTIAGQYEYFIADIDYDTQSIQLWRFNGSTWFLVASTPMPGIDLDQWYRFMVTIKPGAPGQTVITIDARSLAVGSVFGTLVVTTSAYVPSTGWFGLTANRALTYFSYFHVEMAE